ncbi:MAG TPA: hypothetical protein VM598_02655 [Bdellovibrionota bacterium]|nr:hypothetical protein [Bdellovibrionota bacterium]
MSSKHLGPSQIRAIEKVGDCLVPGDGEFPRFSATGCVSQIDRILDYMPATDLKDLKMLLGILALFPRFLLALLFRLLEGAPSVPGPIGAPLRLIRIGMRGLVMSLYYGDPAVLRAMNYKVSVYTGDFGK